MSTARLTTSDMLAALIIAGATQGALLRIDYEAGGPVTARQVAEAAAAIAAGMPPTLLIGELCGIERNKAGQVYLRLFATNRGDHGCYRSINCDFGTLRSLTVERPAASDRTAVHMVADLMVRAAA